MSQRPFLYNYSNNLKDLRIQYNLTQSELADLCHLSRNTICSYERFEYVPSLPIALLIVNVFKTLSNGKINSVNDIWRFEYVLD